MALLSSVFLGLLNGALLWALATRRNGVFALSTAVFFALCVNALLLWYLLFDHFEIDYVWRYSAPALSWWLKLSLWWGGEEGTLALLSLLLCYLARHCYGQSLWVGRTLTAIALVFALSLWRWSPFTPTAVESLAQLPHQGLNAHLNTVWMALHPPLIFIAYALLLVPLGAAWQGLYDAPSHWPQWVARAVRPAWVFLTLGLASGMWWAFQDFTFGQFWHWDPVQTAVFVTWALATAQLHGHRLTRTQLQSERWYLWVSALCAISVPVGLWIVREDSLASSHRYVGDTSAPLMALLSVALLLATVAFWRLGRRPNTPLSWKGQSALLRWANLLLVAVALTAALFLVHALLGASLDWPRDDSTRPFMSAILGWTDAREAKQLEQAFYQWDTDIFAINRWLMPIGLAMTLLIGHSFARSLQRAWAWPLTLAGLLASVGLAHFVAPLSSSYTGTGFTSSQTVAQMPRLDLLVCSVCYPLATALWWVGRQWRKNAKKALRYALPVAGMHLGALLALLGALVAGTLDSDQHLPMNLPQDYGKAFKLREDDGHLILHPPTWQQRADGAWHGQSPAFHAVAQLQIQTHGAEGDQAARIGPLLYRDHRAFSERPEEGSFRQICRITDFRFARATQDPGFMISPLIEHGFWRDQQIWLPAAPPPLKGENRELTLVVKYFPLLSWLWSGLLIMAISAVAYALGQRPKSIKSN